MTNSVEKIVSDVADFLVYVQDFYGPGGIYDMGATPTQIIEATKQYIDQVGTNPEDSLSFCGDSLDREKVRDIMINKFGLKFPEGGIKNIDDYVARLETATSKEELRWN
jgi:hypothetical protein